MEFNEILARRPRDPAETRNGEQLRRGDAHIATKAGVAGHPSLSLSPFIAETGSNCRHHRRRRRPHPRLSFGVRLEDKYLAKELEKRIYRKDFTFRTPYFLFLSKSSDNETQR
ncbi:unnamed protein product [Lasius platythorax]|uniref:Uncharacterized protein n=1 Tax=Lasius platythorax TaxID=488582 RepID=A0AAV2NMT2_9HYME